MAPTPAPRSTLVSQEFISVIQTAKLPPHLFCDLLVRQFHAAIGALLFEQRHMYHLGLGNSFAFD